jgi:DNA repair protein RadD
MKLRQEQVDFIGQIQEGMRLHPRVLAVLPTGGGKTVCFCTIAKLVAARGGKVLILVHRRELLAQTIKRLLAMGVIPKELGHVWVSTIGSRTSFKPDLLIVDEAHHCTSKTWRARIEAYDVPVLGFTATPERLDGKGLGGIFGGLVVGSTAAELMAQGSLSRYRLYAPPVAADLSGVHTVAGDYNKGELAAAIDIPDVAYDAIGNWQRYAPGRRTIAFCVSLIHAGHIVGAFQQIGVQAEQVDGSMATGERAAVIERFRSGATTVLVSVDLVSEGFDVPDCDCVLLLRPTQSLALYLQQVGRGLRPSDEPCVVLDCVGNAARHGLPDDDREWSLEGRKRRAKADAVSVRVCGSCLSAFKPGLAACPYCGWTPPKTVMAVPDTVAATLVEVDQAALRRQVVERSRRKIEVSRARTREALEKIARERSYSLGWVDRVLAARQMVRR